jgi:hypothetical protein
LSLGIVGGWRIVGNRDGSLQNRAKDSNRIIFVVSLVLAGYMFLRGARGFKGVPMPGKAKRDNVDREIINSTAKRCTRVFGLAGGLLAAFYCTPTALANPAYAVQRLNDLGVGVSTTALGMNLAGDVVGTSGQAVIWPAGSGNAMALPLAPGASGGSPFGINDSGVIVGLGVDAPPTGAYPILWTNSLATPIHITTGLSPTDLGSLRAISSTGVFVGDADKGSVNAVPYLGFRASRSVNGSSVTELGNLGTTAAGFTTSTAYGVNSKGDAVGYAEKYSGGSDRGEKAVRWNAGEATAIELATPSGPNSGSGSQALAINDQSVAVGDEGGIALRWNADGSFTMLGSLGSASLSGASSAQSINNSGDIAGYSTKYIGNTLIGRHAAIWSNGGTAVTDLNDVTDLPAGWVLTSANTINDAGMILGYASFDPDGSGPLAAQQFPVRLTPTPEPGLMGLLGISAVVLARRRRVAV